MMLLYVRARHVPTGNGNISACIMISINIMPLLVIMADR